mmetsp:Transcript_1089/g.3223  ORF Transcript_1089/g.3223 Transcript_1089/m.3223 type:complete len:324 (-) Transcript_1089:98-1069(-)
MRFAGLRGCRCLHALWARVLVGHERHHRSVHNRAAGAAWLRLAGLRVVLPGRLHRAGALGRFLVGYPAGPRHAVRDYMLGRVPARAGVPAPPSWRGQGRPRYVPRVADVVPSRELHHPGPRVRGRHRLGLVLQNCAELGTASVDGDCSVGGRVLDGHGLLVFRQDPGLPHAPAVEPVVAADRHRVVADRTLARAARVAAVRLAPHYPVALESLVRGGERPACGRERRGTRRREHGQSGLRAGLAAIPQHPADAAIERRPRRQHAQRRFVPKDGTCKAPALRCFRLPLLARRLREQMGSYAALAHRVRAFPGPRANHVVGQVLH